MTGAEEAFAATREPTRVLLAAERAMFRQVLALILDRHEGIKAAQVGSLAEARQILRDPDAEPDLAVVDLELPSGDAFELIEELRVVWPRTPVLALTTSQEPERAALAKEAGAGAVLTMAASGNELLEGVRRLANG